MSKLSWDLVSLQTKILFLKNLMGNCVDGTFDNSDLNIVDALITGSYNNYSGDMRFEIQDYHMMYMKSAWELAIKSQKDDSVTNSVTYYLKYRKTL